jgi:hypothetical protein
VAEYNRTGMLTRPKAIEPFQIDFMQTQIVKLRRPSVHNGLLECGGYHC